MLNEKLKSKIHDLLNERCFKDDQGLFYTEIYADYRDDIPENCLKKISEAENPRDTFHDCVMDAYESCEHDDSYEMLQQICRNEMIAEAINQGETSEDEIREYLWDHHYVQLPYDHFLKQDIAVDILLDTGNANYDFTLNQPFASWGGQGDKTIDECSAILWLSRQQGYSKRQLTNALKHGEFQESKFLKSRTWYTSHQLWTSGTFRHIIAKSRTFEPAYQSRLRTGGRQHQFSQSGWRMQNGFAAHRKSYTVYDCNGYKSIH